MLINIDAFDLRHLYDPKNKEELYNKIRDSKRFGAR